MTGKAAPFYRLPVGWFAEETLGEPGRARRGKYYGFLFSFFFSYGLRMHFNPCLLPRRLDILVRHRLVSGVVSEVVRPLLPSDVGPSDARCCPSVLVFVLSFVLSACVPALNAATHLCSTFRHREFLGCHRGWLTLRSSEPHSPRPAPDPTLYYPPPRAHRSLLRCLSSVSASLHLSCVRRLVYGRRLSPRRVTVALSACTSCGS